MKLSGGKMNRPESLLDSIDVLVSQRDELKQKANFFEKFLDATNKMLACYRLNRRPSEKLLDELLKYEIKRDKEYRGE
jgi:hypothetical protein